MASATSRGRMSPSICGGRERIVVRLASFWGAREMSRWEMASRIALWENMLVIGRKRERERIYRID